MLLATLIAATGRNLIDFFRITCCFKRMQLTFVECIFTSELYCLLSFWLFNDIPFFTKLRANFVRYPQTLDIAQFSEQVDAWFLRYLGGLCDQVSNPYMREHVYQLDVKSEQNMKRTPRNNQNVLCKLDFALSRFNNYA